MFFPCLGLLLVSLSGVLGSNIAPVVIKPTAVAERDIFSSISVVGPTVSLAAPQRMCVLVLQRSISTES